MQQFIWKSTRYGIEVGFMYYFDEKIRFYTVENSQFEILNLKIEISFLMFR